MSQATGSNSGMPTRTLGRTGVEVSLVGLGGWHLGFDYIDEQLSIRIIRKLVIFSAEPRSLPPAESMNSSKPPQSTTAPPSTPNGSAKNHPRSSE